MYYTDRLMLRSFDLRADEARVTQMFNDVDDMWAMSPEAPRAGQYNAKQFLEAAIKAGETGPPSFAICLKPDESEHPNQLGTSDDLFVKDELWALGSTSSKNIKVSLSDGKTFVCDTNDHLPGKGYGSEILNWAMDYLFNHLNVHKCECTVSSENAPALRLYEKIGFVREGTFRERFFKNGKTQDYQYGLLEQEYRARKAKS